MGFFEDAAFAPRARLTPPQPQQPHRRRRHLPPRIGV